MNFLRDYLNGTANAHSLDQAEKVTRVNYEGRRAIEWNALNGDITAVYIVEVSRGPNWWLGLDENGPQNDIISNLPERVKEKIRNKELMLIILSDTEEYHVDIHENHLDIIFKAMSDNRLPAGSVVIASAAFDTKVYEQYCKKHGRMIQMFYGTMRDRFVNSREETSVEKAISYSFSRDFNSLNHTNYFRPHVTYHAYTLLVNNFIKRGLVSLNKYVDERNGDEPSNIHAYFPPMQDKVYNKLMSKYYPRSIDFEIDDLIVNQKPDETNIPYDIYNASLLTFVNETNVNSPTVLSEKIFKPIAAGQPFIYVGAAGSLSRLKQLGYTVDMLDIDTSYDDIDDNAERVMAANKELIKWVKKPRATKIELITESLPNIKRNQMIEQMNSRLMNEITKQARKYFK